MAREMATHMTDLILHDLPLRFWACIQREKVPVPTPPVGRRVKLAGRTRGDPARGSARGGHQGGRMTTSVRGSSGSLGSIGRVVVRRLRDTAVLLSPAREPRRRCPACHEQVSLPGTHGRGKTPRCVAMSLAPAHAGIRRIATRRDTC
jgi:hypothetical protein